MKNLDTNINTLLKQSKQLDTLMTELGFSTISKIKELLCVKKEKQVIDGNDIYKYQINNNGQVYSKKQIIESVFGFLIFKIQSPNQIDIGITINLTEKRIIAIEVPHSYMQENEIYEFATYWIGLVPKIRKISEFLKKLQETKKKVKRKRT